MDSIGGMVRVGRSKLYVVNRNSFENNGPGPALVLFSLQFEVHAKSFQISNFFPMSVTHVGGTRTILGALIGGKLST